MNNFVPHLALFSSFLSLHSAWVLILHTTPCFETPQLVFFPCGKTRNLVVVATSFQIFTNQILIIIFPFTQRYVS